MDQAAHNVFSVLLPDVQISAAGSNCVTIDHTSNDNGFLNCARAGFSGASNHASTSEAIQNLLRCFGGGKGNANIVGHGNDGLIVTGTGQIANDPAKYMATANPSYWQPHVRQLRGHVTSLALWACHPGTASTGADFLYAMAQTANCQVSGPTGFLYCQNGRLWLEAKSVWQVATPTHRPNPIPAPSPHFSFFDEINLSFSRTDERRTTMRLDSVDEVTYSQTIGRSVEAKTISGNNAHDFLQLVRFDSPFDPGGQPAALVTGVLTIRSGDQTLEFNVYNDRLLQSRSEPTVFFQATEGFPAALRLLF